MSEVATPPGSPRGLGRATLAGLVWLTVQSVGGRVIGLVSQLVLAWILAPADFGAIGLAYTVRSLAGQLMNFGVDEVLLQRRRAMHRWAPPAFWISLGLGLVAMAAVFAAAPVASTLYRDPGLTGLLLVLGPSLPLGALSTVPGVRMRSDMRFRFLATYATVELFAYQGLTIALALAGYGAYSFVIPAPLFAAIKAGWFWRAAPLPIVGPVRLSRWRLFGGRGLAVFSSRLLSESQAQGDYVCLGLFADKIVVGLYFFAFRIAAQPVRMLAGNFTAVLLPALITFRGQPERQKAAALRAARLLAYLVMPFCALQAALADPGLRLLFGAKWVGSIPLLQLLSVGLAFDAVSWVAGAYLNAQGRFRRHLFYSIVFTPVFFAVVLTGAVLGKALGVACGVALYHAALQPVYTSLVFGREARGALAELYLVPLVMAAASVGAGYAVSLAPALAHNEPLRLAVILAIGPPAYVVALWKLRPALFSEILRRAGLDRLARLRLSLTPARSRPETSP